MMKRLRLLIIAGVTAFMVSGMTSCTLDIPPADQYADPDAIVDVKTARAYLTNSYIEFPHIQYELSVLANDFCMTENTRFDVDIANLYKWKHKNIKDMSENLWLEYYHVIAGLDALEARLGAVTSISDADNVKIKQIIAEMYALKAMAYFNVLRLYSPRYDEGDDVKGLIIKKFLGIEYNKRTSVAQSVKYINHLLEQASSIILSRQIEGAVARPGWLYKEAVEYLKAEVSLYMGDYQSVIKYAEPLLELAPEEIEDFSTLWSKSNLDIIFAFNTRAMYYNSIEYDSKFGDYFALNPDFIFEEGDLRKDSYTYKLKANKSSQASNILFGKYNKIRKEGGSISYIDNMRFSALYFMLAESYARLGMDAEARKHINKYLKKVNSPLVKDELVGQNLITRILQEKFKEFSGEGRNYFDLKRLQKSLEKKGLWNTSGISISSDDYKWTFPIPNTELRYNEVQQNDGWF